MRGSKKYVNQLVPRADDQLNRLLVMSKKAGNARSVLTPALEDYLKAIYKLQLRNEKEVVSTGAIAEAMGFSSASVTNTAKRLDELGLADYESYKGLRLTEAGRKVALEVLRHHRLLELYLRQELGYQWDMVHEEAEHLEHHISEEFEDKLDELLGYPTHDPHGDPIPTRSGQVAETAATSLIDVEAGQACTIQRVSDTDPELLTYLENLDLLPRKTVKVLDKAPFNGPLTLQVSNRKQIIGNEIASKIFVEVA